MDSSLLFGSALVLYLAASAAYISFLAFRKEGAGLAATAVTITGFVVHTAALSMRWYEKAALTGFGHIPPLSNMYESMIFLSWSIILLYLIFEKIYGNRSLGAIVTPLAFMAIAGVSIAPNITDEIQPLVPALQSNWLTIHVMTSFLGYAAFAISFGVSVLYLIFAARRRETVSYTVGMINLVAAVTLLGAIVADYLTVFISGAPRPHLFAATFASPDLAVRLVFWLAASFLFSLLWHFGSLHRGKAAALFPGLKVLDDISHKTVMVGFPMLTIGIITGAAWANYAWGTYWSWDPKETWSLITWFIYAAFLHARFTAGWKGERTSMLSVVGFSAVMFTYLGVNFLLSGIHSYN